mgnify:CR=1 FL=1
MYEILDEIKGLLSAAMTTSITKYYVGKVHNPAINQLPILAIYGDNTTLIEKSTARDRYQHTIKIEILTNAYRKVNATGGVEADGVLDAQKQILDLFEEVDANHTPKTTTVLGVLRENIKGTDYLFNDDIVIQYETENVEGEVYYRGVLTFTVDQFRSRPS